MKKYVKLAVCGLAAMMLVAGCSKKTEAPAESSTEAASTEATTGVEASTQAAEEPEDKGVITKLGEYKGVEAERMSTEVSDEELEARIQNILAANPEYIEITDRPAKEGDIVNIDYVGMKDGVAFDGGTAQGYDLELGSHSFIDGFEDGLIGANKGDELSLNLTFPEQYHSEELAGQAVVFDVTVNSIEEKKDAVLDDNFVQRMSDFSTVDEFKADTLADMEAEKEKEADQKLESDLLQKVLDSTEFDLNQEAVDWQFNNQLNYFTSMVEMYGMKLEDYVVMYGMTEDQFKEELKNMAEQTVKQQLVFEAIAGKEGLEPGDADREKVAKQYGMDVETLNSTYGEEAVNETARMFQVVDFIRDNAVVK